MTRIDEVSSRKAGLLARFAFFISRRVVGKVVTPLRVKAHHRRLLRGYIHMELAQQAAHSVAPALKTLVSVAAARRIGCPF
jgi:hypothetical protein